MMEMHNKSCHVSDGILATTEFVQKFSFLPKTLKMFPKFIGAVRI